MAPFEGEAVAVLADYNCLVLEVFASGAREAGLSALPMRPVGNPSALLITLQVPTEPLLLLAFNDDLT